MHKKNKILSLAEKKAKKSKESKQKAKDPLKVRVSQLVPTTQTTSTVSRVSTEEKQSQEKSDEKQKLREKIILELHKIRRELFLEIEMLKADPENKDNLREKVLTLTSDAADLISEEEEVAPMLAIYTNYRKSAEKAARPSRALHLKAI